MMVGDTVRTVNSDSGEVDFFLVTMIFGSRWFGRSISGSEAGQNPLTIRVAQGTYGLVPQR